MEKKLLHYIEEDHLHRSIFKELNRLEISDYLKRNRCGNYQNSLLAHRINPILNFIFHLRLYPRFFQSINISNDEILSLRTLKEPVYLLLLGAEQTIVYAKDGDDKTETNEREEVIVPLSELISTGNNCRWIHLQEMKNGDLLYLPSGIIGTLNGSGSSTLILLS